MEVEGRIKVINPEQQVSATFKKRELVVTTDEQYPQHIMVEFVQDKCDLLNNFRVGEPVKVSINIRGREWVSPQGETKYFNSIQGWRVERLAPAAQAPAPGQAQAPVQHMAPAQAFQPATDFNEQEHDDLPF
jgi:single-stranded DNA-binding protein